MDLSKIKNFIKQNGDKFILLENGEPEIVVMSFDEYQKMVSGLHINTKPRVSRYPFLGQDARVALRDFSQPDFNEEIVSQTEFVGDEASETQSLAVRPESIRLEDLPL